MPDNLTPTPAADSAAQQHVYYAPQWADGFPQPQPGDSAVQSVTQLPVMQAVQTVDPTPNVSSPLRDPGTMGMVLVALFLVMVSYRTGYKYLENFAHNLFSIRRRENLFDDHTMNETQILTALTINTCVMLGVIAFYAVDLCVPSLSASLHASVWVHTALYAGLALVFYLLQLAVYNVVGRVFADVVATRLWTQGFKAAHSLLGILLLPVTGALLLWPQYSNTLLIIVIILYFCCRITFICKGFRIFYTNLPSIVYFILYLCSVEIVPIVLLSASTVFLSSII